MQTLLEKQGIESRKENISHNNTISSVLRGYNKEDEYSVAHKNALSDGDVQGKGTSYGGHTHTTPNPDKPKAIDYAAFNTNNGGNTYDVEGRDGKGGRNFLKTISLYNEENQYGAHMIDTSANKIDGQIIM